jgi:hypothetical protein
LNLRDIGLIDQKLPRAMADVPIISTASDDQDAAQQSVRSPTECEKVAGRRSLNIIALIKDHLNAGHQQRAKL